MIITIFNEKSILGMIRLPQGGLMDCSGHRSANLFIIEISSHNHIKRKQPQTIFL